MAWLSSAVKGLWDRVPSSPALFRSSPPRTAKAFATTPEERRQKRRQLKERAVMDEERHSMALDDNMNVQGLDLNQQLSARDKASAFMF